MNEANTGADGGANEFPGSDDRPDFEPVADPDDEFFAVVKTDYLAELLRIYEPTDVNAAFLIREGVGLKARSRTENCYWFEVEIPADEFAVFQAEDRDYDVDIDALGRVVADTDADRIAIQAGRDGTIAVRDGRGSHRIGADQVPLDEQDEDDPLRSETLIDGKMLSTTEFTVEAVDLGALVGADQEHDHAGITVDAVANTAEVYFFDADADTRTVSLQLAPDDFLDQPSHVESAHEEPDVVSMPVCRDSIDDAMTPISGAVTVTVSSITRIAPLYLEYTCADGALPVYAFVTQREGSIETFNAVKPE